MDLKANQLNEGLQLLFENYWILRKENPREYRKLRSIEKDLRRIVSERFGYRIYFHTDFIKLEKLPVESSPWMGILEFEEQMDYVIFCCVLAFLEEKDVPEYFLLSHLCEEIPEIYPGFPKVDWINYQHRKSLVRVVQKCLELHLIETVDGDIENFSRREDVEVLYVTTIYSRYFMRPYPQDIYQYANWLELHDDEKIDDESPNSQRHKMYRQLYTQPCILREEVDANAFYYLRNQRNSISDFTEQYSPYELEIYQNVAMLTVTNRTQKLTQFPSTKVIDDILVQLATLIREKGVVPDVYGKVHYPKGNWRQLLGELQQLHSPLWSKEFRTKSLDQLDREIIKNGENWSFLKELDDEVEIFPSFARINGYMSNEKAGTGKGEN